MKAIDKRLDDLWSELVKLRAGNKCEQCGGTHRLCIHHKTYESQTINDLEVLCFGCHARHHREEAKKNES